MAVFANLYVQRYGIEQKDRNVNLVGRKTFLVIDLGHEMGSFGKLDHFGMVERKQRIVLHSLGTEKRNAGMGSNAGRRQHISEMLVITVDTIVLEMERAAALNRSPHGKNIATVSQIHDQLRGGRADEQGSEAVFTADQGTVMFFDKAFQASQSRRALTDCP